MIRFPIARIHWSEKSRDKSISREVLNTTLRENLAPSLLGPLPQLERPGSRARLRTTLPLVWTAKLQETFRAPAGLLGSLGVVTSRPGQRQSLVPSQPEDHECLPSPGAGADRAPVRSSAPASVDR